MQPAAGSLAAKCSTVSTSCSLTGSVCCSLLSKARAQAVQLLQHLENKAEQSRVWLKIKHSVQCMVATVCGFVCHYKKITTAA